MEGLMKYFVTLLAALLMGCATPYGDGLFGGVKATRLSQNVVLISASGNAYTDNTRIAEYMLLRAAEEAHASGYPYFAVMDSKNTGYVSSGTVYTPYTTDFSGTANSFSPYTTTYSGTATTYGGPQTYSFYKPGGQATFALLNEVPEGLLPGQYYETAFVLNSLGSKYISDFEPIVTP